MYIPSLTGDTPRLPSHSMKFATRLAHLSRQSLDFDRDSPLGRLAGCQAELRDSLGVGGRNCRLVSAEELVDPGRFGAEWRLRYGQNLRPGRGIQANDGARRAGFRAVDTEHP